MTPTLRLTGDAPIDAPVVPLCEALTAAGCTTVYSCGAHLEAFPPRDRAYVTFLCTDAAWVSHLRDALNAPAGALQSVRRELQFDCLLGRYTVSVWAPAGARARAALDAALTALTAWIMCQPPACAGDRTLCGVAEGRPPRELVPCRLTLHDVPTRCGWTGAPLTPAS